MTKSEVKVLLDRSELLEEEVEIYKEQYRDLKKKGKGHNFPSSRTICIKRKTTRT